MCTGRLSTTPKTGFFTGAMTNVHVQMLAAMLGFSAGSIPFIYLGCPNFKGKSKGSHFLSVTDRIKAKLATWKGTTLFIVGHIQFVKSIIHGMLVYSFYVSWKIMCCAWAAGDLDIKPTCMINDS